MDPRVRQAQQRAARTRVKATPGAPMQWLTGVVQAVVDREAVIVDVRGVSYGPVSTPRGYSPSVGEKVDVFLAGTQMGILGSPGPSPAAADLPAASPVTSVTFAATEPAAGTGWRGRAGVAFKDGVLRIVEDATLDAAPPPPVAPASAFRDASAYSSWQDGRRRTDEGRVWQGQYRGNGFHEGFWFFPDFPAMQVTSARIRLRRSAGGHGYTYGPVLVWLRLHNGASVNSKPGFTSSAMSGVYGTTWALSLGQEAEFKLPVEWGQSLADGTSTGVSVSTPNRDDYIIYDSSPARITLNG